MSRKSILPFLFLAATIVPLSAAPILFSASLSGPNEEPPNASPGIGSVLVSIDAVAHVLTVEGSFLNLIGTTTAAHIHVINGPGDTNLLDTLGPVATQTPSFTSFPLGVTAGTFNQTLDTTLASSFRAGFVTDSGGTPGAAEAALFAAILEGRAYFNIHSTVFTGGEIRGFLEPVAVPEPAAAGLLAISLAAFAMRIRRRPR